MKGYRLLHFYIPSGHSSHCTCTASWIAFPTSQDMVLGQGPYWRQCLGLQLGSWQYISCNCAAGSRRSHCPCHFNGKDCISSGKTYCKCSVELNKISLIHDVYLE